MKKRTLYAHEFKNARELARTEYAIVLKLGNGSILKVFDPSMIEILKSVGYDIEAKILDAVPLKKSPEIIVPTSAIYSEENQFYAYTEPCANGISYNQYDRNLTISQRENLKRYALIYSKLEKILKRNPDIVFPDFCTCDNIFIDNGNIQLIDYDGLQIGKHKSFCISTSLGDVDKYMSIPKYCDENGLFTKELDKKSLIIFYFLTAFNVDLNKIGKIDPFSGEIMTLEKILDCMKLDDPDICNKVWKIFQDDQPNEYLGDDVFRIAEKYDMKVVAKLGERHIKQLYKKH